jgi:hypothetical protein
MPSTAATDPFHSLEHPFPPLSPFEGCEGHQGWLTILAHCSFPLLLSGGKPWSLKGAVGNIAQGRPAAPRRLASLSSIMPSPRVGP